MQILAQSQAPTKVSYIHLAYIAAALSKHISKGELYPMQAVLGVALVAAVVCGAIRVRLQRSPKKLIRTGFLAFVGTIGALIFIEREWGGIRSNEAVVEHVIKTHQFWALREAPIAAGIEAAGLTNAEAAALAGNYYYLSGGGSATGDPVLFVKTKMYGELATTKGVKSWAGVDPKKDWTAYDPVFKSALESGKLNPAEQTWVKRHLAELELKTQLEQDGLNK